MRIYINMSTYKYLYNLPELGWDRTLGIFIGSTMETKLFFNISEDLWPFSSVVINFGFRPLLYGHSTVASVLCIKMNILAVLAKNRK